MRFLVDECTGKRFAELLRQEGHDVLFAGDVSRSMPDEEIIALAERENSILITDDKDFGRLVFRLNRPARGVILLRMGTSPNARLEAVKRLLETREISDAFVVLGETAFRIRKMQH
jgi:predicted nuclease of predicted toxin-antitoxin system